MGGCEGDGPNEVWETVGVSNHCMVEGLWRMAVDWSGEAFSGERVLGRAGFHEGG